MTVDDLKLSDSTRGFLHAKNLTVEKLVAKRDDLTSIKGIGPSRAQEIETALVEAERIGDASEAERLPEPKAAAPALRKEEPEAEAPAPFSQELPKEIPKDKLVRYMDHAGTAMMARVGSANPDGSLNLQAFSGKGGTRRVEKVHRAGTWGERNRWDLPEEV